MRNMLFSMSVCGLLMMLVGCGTTSPTLTGVNQKWKGVESEKFFEQFGPPRENYTTSTGEKIYVWQSRREQYSERIQGQTESPRVGQRREAPVWSINTYCVLKIRVDSQDRIHRISLMEDTYGQRADSRFEEIFGPTLE